MGRQILAAALLVVLLSMALMGTVSTGLAEKFLLDKVEENLLSNARLMERIVAEYLASPGETKDWEVLARSLGQDVGARVTIIDPHGAVLGDSDAVAAELESHLERPEIQAAFRGELGKSYRYSTSLRIEMLYLALPVSVEGTTGGVIRVALPLAQVEEFYRSFWEKMWVVGLVGLLVALVTSSIAAMKLAKPLQEVSLAAVEMARGQYNRRLKVRKAPAEIRVLINAFNQMADNLAQSIGKLTERKNRLETVLASLDDSLIAVDREGQVVMLNPPAAALFQISEGEALRRHLLEVIRHEGLYEAVSDVLENRKVIHREMCLFVSQEKIFRVHVAPIVGQGTWGAVVVLRDMTEIRRTERMRKEFVANVSHELNTPLTSIAGYVETLLDGAYQDPGVNLRFLGIIHKETERLKRLIEDLLQLSQIESQKGQIAFLPVELSGVIAKTTGLLATTLAEKGQDLELDFPASLPKVKATEDSLEQVFLNLIDNAIKYSPPGSRITVKAWEEDNMVAVSVVDQGQGIPPEALPRIFERFYRVEKSRAREIPGTGLGLAIVKHLVDSLEGAIEVTSQPGQGSRFTVKLPKVPSIGG